MYDIFFLLNPLFVFPSLLLNAVFFGIVLIVVRDRKSKEVLIDQVGRTREINPKLLEIIRHKLEDEQLYLNKDLSLNDLAMEVGSNRCYVSNCINDHYGQSFIAVVNEFRVHYAKSLIEMSDGLLTMAAIRDKSGYESDSTFIRNFKKEFGCTPSEWQRNHKKPNN